MSIWMARDNNEIEWDIEDVRPVIRNIYDWSYLLKEVATAWPSNQVVISERERVHKEGKDG